MIRENIGMGNVMKPKTRHLKVVEATDASDTLGEYAGNSDIAAGLREKLGSDSLWLFATEMYGIVIEGDSRADYMGLTEGMGMPVRYIGLRELTIIDDMDEVDRQTVTVPVPHEKVAVFRVDQFNEKGGEQLLTSGNVVAYYSEIAVRLGQAVMLLNYNEHHPGSPRWELGRPGLRIIYGDMSEGCMDA
jgi:hypothetical protein